MSTQSHEATAALLLPRLLFSTRHCSTLTNQSTTSKLSTHQPSSLLLLYSLLLLTKDDGSVGSFASDSSGVSNSGVSFQDGQGVDPSLFDESTEDSFILLDNRNRQRGSGHRTLSSRSRHRSSNKNKLPTRPENRVYGEGAPPAHKRRKQFDQNGQLLNQNGHQQILQPLPVNEDNMPGGKRRNAAAGKPGAAATLTRNSTAVAKLKESEKENQNLKKQLEDLKKLQATGKRKRHQVFMVELDKGFKTQLSDVIRQHVWPNWQFLASEEEEIAAMTMAIEKVDSEWKKVKDLDEEDLKEQVKEYLKIYGKELTSKINAIRNQMQQNMRKEWVGSYKNGDKVSAKQFLIVAQRPADLIELEEVDEDENELPENKQHNEKNKKRRDRFVLWIDTMMGIACGKKLFGPEKRSQHCISSYKYADGKEVIPAGMEAMVILMLENAQAKWAFEGDLELKWNRTMVNADRKTKPYKKNCPDTPYTTVKGGNNKYGGWTKEGRIRFAKIRALIQKGRQKDTTEELEEQTREAIQQLHQNSTSSTNEEEGKDKVDLSEAQIGCSSQVDDDLEEEDCNSDDELELLKVDNEKLFDVPVHTSKK